MQLLIMAAGMGSRFGGLKQIEPMGPNDEFIIDYSVYDAVKAGFSKVVFIIKKENEEVFKETIGKRVEGHIPVDYVFQEMNDIPEWVNIPEGRVKPWGTAQAIYAARDAITEPFLVINSDDFYGRDAFMTAKKYIEETGSKNYSTICYEARKTMTENGSVKRGVVESEGDLLKSITESKLELIDGSILASPLDGSEPFKIEDSHLVAVNLFTFDLSIFPFLKERMDIFFKENENDLENCEFLLPTEISNAVENKEKEVRVLRTNAKWHGVTYKEDTPIVKDAIKSLIDNNEYPNNLWK
ncbi:MAG: nucleotidyltransferase [Bacilli bacterium]|nr:nucleotidyltransferase [Bacilli bacterium]